MVVPTEEKLHKGAGVRRPDLARFLTGSFAERLHVFDDDASHVVLAKIIWQVSEVVRQVTRDQKWITVLDAMYNLRPDPELNPLDLTGRLKMLERRNGSGWDPSTTNTKLSELRRAHVFPRLKGKFPWPPENVIEELALSEAKYESRQETAGPRMIALPEGAIGSLIAGMSQVGQLECVLPQLPLHFIVSAEGNLVTTQTAELGELLPVFTGESLLRQYLEQVGAPESDVPTVALGHNVIDVLVARGRVGLALNPLGNGAAPGQYWTAEGLADL